MHLSPLSSPANRRQTLQWLAASGMSLGAWPPHAQAAWPSKPIRFVVPFVPGGTSDIVARAAPDGYTVILGHVCSMAVDPLIYPDSGFDVNRDFAPVTLLAKVPSLVVVHKDVPTKGFKSFVAYAKSRPGQLNYASAGNASAGHPAMECLKLATGMFITHMPYRGTGPALNDLLAGRVNRVVVRHADPRADPQRHRAAPATRMPQSLAIAQHQPTLCQRECGHRWRAERSVCRLHCA